MLLSKESSSGRAEASCHVCPVSIHWLCRLGKWAAASDAAPARLLSEQCCIPKAAVFFPPCAYLAHFLAVASYHAAHKAKPVFAEKHVIGLPSSGSGKAGVKPAQFAALLAQVCRGAIKNGWSGERAAPWCTELTRPCRIPRWVPFFLFILRHFWWQILILMEKTGLSAIIFSPAESLPNSTVICVVCFLEPWVGRVPSFSPPAFAVAVLVPSRTPSDGPMLSLRGRGEWDMS